MKRFFLGIFSLLTVTVYSQETKEPFDGHTWQAPYSLPLPKEWGVERFLLPPSFAPQIIYKGVEDIRFMPGWRNSKSNEYWSYAFIWWLDEKPATGKKSIEADLETYYDGLLKENTDSTKTGNESPMPAMVKLRRSVTEQDETFYSGTVELRDFLSRQRIKLNCKVHIRSCKETGKQLLFFELSPKPFDHDVWEGLDGLWINFQCTKNH